MQLHVHADASYLSERKARSRVAGHFFMVKIGNGSFNNGPILTISTIIRHAMASAAEAELAAVFYSAQEAKKIRQLLSELGHKQQQTPITTDNATAHGLINGVMIPRKSKAMDMRFHWLQCRCAQQQFDFQWDRGPKNRADYLSKHHPPLTHTQKRGEYLVNSCCDNFFMRRANKKSPISQVQRMLQRGRRTLQGCAGKSQRGTARPRQSDHHTEDISLR